LAFLLMVTPGLTPYPPYSLVHPFVASSVSEVVRCRGAPSCGCGFSFPLLRPTLYFASSVPSSFLLSLACTLFPFVFDRHLSMVVFRKPYPPIISFWSLSPSVFHHPVATFFRYSFLASSAALLHGVGSVEIQFSFFSPKITPGVVPSSADSPFAWISSLIRIPDRLPAFWFTLT